MSDPPRIMHPTEEGNLRRWCEDAGDAQVVILSRATVASFLGEVDAARAGRPVMIGAPVPAYQMAKEAAQLAPDGEE